MQIFDYNSPKNNFRKYKEVESVLLYGVIDYSPKDLTVVIPTYRRLDGLRRALKSALQDFADLKVEILVVDNDQFEFEGSQTQKILLCYDRKTVKYYQNKKNIGMFGNWNRCIELANSPWISMLHDDDILAEKYYQKAKILLMKAKKDSNLAYIGAYFCKVHDEKIIAPKSNFKILASRYCGAKMYKLEKRDTDWIPPLCAFTAPTCGSLMRRDAFLLGGGFDELYYPSSDVVYLYKLMDAYNFNTAKSVCLLGYYTRDDGAPYSSEDILGLAEGYASYIRFYQQKSVISTRRWKFYSNEMINGYKDFLYRLVDDSMQINKDMNLKEKINEILPSKYDSFRRCIFNVTNFIYWRHKQLIAMIFG